jgi:TetR/AcrR family transcriptional regulator, cholesterol catabolism regulator
MEKENRIIQGALDLFIRMGVKSVNMDDVARHLGMSKKTLYQHVNNKEDLVEKSFAHHHCCMKQMIEGICKKHDNAIDEVFEIDERVCQTMMHNHPSLLVNLKRYYPKVWGFMDDLKKKSIFKTVKNNLERGVEQGLYRADINPDIIAKFMINRVDALINEDLFPLTEYDFKQLLRENRVYHIRGIATPKGIEYLAEKLKND